MNMVKELEGKMNSLNIAENIVRLRKNKKLTQEQLADFIGVTKASVSKWENSQSTPDITILPQLAAFFNVTIDELVGYEPQLSKEQIRKLYQDFAKEFAQKPFDEVMQKTKSYVKRYYSCYAFLFQVCVLWLNHYTLAENNEKKADVLKMISELCDHIKSDCSDVKICNDVIIIRAMAELQRGHGQEVIDSIEDLEDPLRFSRQGQTILIQAYLMTGNQSEADSFTQLSMYNSVFELISEAACYLTVKADDAEKCMETIKRIENVIETYCLIELNPNSVAGFEYQAAICSILNGNFDKAAECMEKYAACILKLFKPDGMKLHGDSYFDNIMKYFEMLDSGTQAPRDRKVVLEDVKKTMENPVFEPIKDNEKFKNSKKSIEHLEDI